jgi:IS5 family transposase
MYRKSDKSQMLIEDFVLPFGGKLDASNRWIKLSKLIPWDKVEERYSENFKSNCGNVALTARIALGSLIIKEKCSFSDEETIQQISENPYMQYFLGFKELKNSIPFEPSLMVAFRKRLSFVDINEMMLEISINIENKDDVNDKPNGGSMIIDATCTPADIHYPTDLALLNEGREKLEEIVDCLYEQVKEKYKTKPRTYRQNARKNFLKVEKQRKSKAKTIQKAIRKQLGYVCRDLKIVDELVANGAKLGKLSKRKYRDLLVIGELFRQQNEKFKSKSTSIDNRIVSISQPHVRPIVRGKASAKTEFGAKIAVCIVDGYSFIEDLEWENFNEATRLIKSIERYKLRFGFYPIAVLADKIYRNRENISCCKERGIRLSGPKLGRPSVKVDALEKKIHKQDEGERNLIESTFGVGKRRFGLGRIMAKLQCTSETVIALQFLIMNLEHKLRVLLLKFLDLVLYPFFSYKFSC